MKFQGIIKNPYDVETKAINQAVKRNIERFPEEFRFQLTKEEYTFLRSQSVTSKTSNDFLRSQIATLNEDEKVLRSQFATSKTDEVIVETRGGRQYLPYVFTEQGVAMLYLVNMCLKLMTKQKFLIIL